MWFKPVYVAIPEIVTLEVGGVVIVTFERGVVELVPVIDELPEIVTFEEVWYEWSGIVWFKPVYVAILAIFFPCCIFYLFNYFNCPLIIYVTFG